MAHSTILVALALVMQAAQPAQSLDAKLAGWTKFKSVEGRYSVLMPGTPKETIQQVPSALGKLDMHMALCETDKGGAYLVMYSEYPGPIFPEQLDKIYDSARDGGVANSGGGKLVEEKKIKFLDVPAREIMIEIPADKIPGGGLLAIRFFLKGTRLYQAVTACPKKDFKRDEVTAYFDSLQVTDPPADQLGQVQLGPRKFTSAEGRYSIEMPATPRQSTQKVNAPPLGEIEVHLASAIIGPDEQYIVTFNDYPGGKAPDGNLETIYDLSRDGGLANTPGGTLVTERKIKLGDLSGREVKIAIKSKEFPDGGSMVVRYFIKGSRLYQVLAIAPNPTFNEKNVTAFLDSFQITPDNASK